MESRLEGAKTESGPPQCFLMHPLSTTDAPRRVFMICIIKYMLNETVDIYQSFDYLEKSNKNMRII